MRSSLINHSAHFSRRRGTCLLLLDLTHTKSNHVLFSYISLPIARIYLLKLLYFTCAFARLSDVCYTSVSANETSSATIRHQEAHLGQLNAVLQCPVCCKSSLDINTTQWTFQSGPLPKGIKQEQDKLIIQEVTYDVLGEYQCSVVNHDLLGLANVDPRIHASIFFSKINFFHW